MVAMATSSARGALRVGQVFLADFFADGDDDALPADHGAHAERQGNRHLHPGGNELGGLVDFALVGWSDGSVLGRGEGGVVVLLHEPDGLAGHVHVVAHVGLLVGGDGLELLVEATSWLRSSTSSRRASMVSGWSCLVRM